jgi:phage portal protein BeeE
VWLAPTEARVTKELTGVGIYSKYKIEGLLRADTKGRGEFYRIMREVGAFSANDIRELEEREPIEGGDSYLQPMNMEPLGTEGTDDAPDDAA